MEWTVDDLDTTDLVTSSGIFGGLEGYHVDVVDGVDLSALSCELSSVLPVRRGLLMATLVFHWGRQECTTWTICRVISISLP
ncbi:hypothetical protein SUGI_0983490 [Cryptomeria japonica]|nr:hypothetical protein SUGI_0983490 [Cryptomeria japonica]